MRDLDDAVLERRLRAVLDEHLGALPLDLTIESLDQRRKVKGVARRFGRGRDVTVLAAAALLLVGGALAAGSGFLRLPSVVPPLPAPSVVAITTASPDATSVSPSEVPGPSVSPIVVAGPGGVWIPTGTMGMPFLEIHGAVRLFDGRVLVIGGDAANGGDRNPPRPPFEPDTAQLYDPASGTWSAAGNMLAPEAGFPPTLLLDGEVLVGHVDEPATYPDVSTIGAEVYDPEKGTWTATGKMVRGPDSWATDFGSTATLLRDGKVLVTGQGGAQVYDPESGTWSATGTMITPRHSHTATLLRDGMVLAAAGYDGGDEPLGSAELYDPATRSWTAAASTHFDPRGGCLGCPGGSGWATLLQDGTVLLIRQSREYADAEIYDPATGAWTELAAPTEFGFPRALLSDGTVLMTDLHYSNGEPAPCTAAALYEPRTGSSTTASSMLRCAHGSSFMVLPDGTVLAAGGRACNEDGVCVSTGAAELYVPAGVSLPSLPAFPSPAPAVFPSPTLRPTPLPPAAGPVPPNPRSWTVTVENMSSAPAVLVVAEEDESGMLRLVGSATPNVVPPGATVKVTFRFPAEGAGDGWIYVNPRPGEGGPLVSAADIGISGKIVITKEGTGGWLSP